MSATVATWGNSLGIRIPKSITDALGISAGTPVNVKLEGTRVIVEPVHKRKYTVADLLVGVTMERDGAELDWGPLREGEEV